MRQTVTVGGPARHRCAMRGFTLVEILVVIVVIGVVVSFAMVSFGVLGTDSQVEDEAKRFRVVLTQALEEAALQGRDIGVFLENAAYEFMVFEPRRGGWQEVVDDPLLRRRELPDELGFRLWLESREILLKPPGREDRERVEQRLPQIVALGSGEITPFELHLERRAALGGWRITSQPDMSLVAEPLDAAR